MSTALAVWGAIDSVHTAFEKQHKNHPGKVPVLKLVDVIRSKMPNGTSFLPALTIDRWVPRPDDMPAPVASSGKLAKPVRTGAFKHGDMDVAIPM